MLSDSELARRVDGRIELRPMGLRISWALADLATTDGHSAVGSFSCTARPLPSATEQKMLEEALLSSRSSVRAADVAAYFAGALQSAARDHSRGLDAQSLLSETGRQNLTLALMNAAKAVAFTCGIELLPPMHLDLDCPTLRRQQTQQRRSAETSEQLRRSGELFAQFQTIRASAPQLSPGQVLQRIGVADQADLLRSLLLASAGKSAPARLWAVAGPALIQITGDESPAPRIIPLPAELGPLRSVGAGIEGRLLIGCRSGIMHVDPASPESAAMYRDPQVTSQLGFNTAVALGNRIFATHSEAGMVAWQIDKPEQPEFALRPQDASVKNFSPRNLLALDADRLLLSSGRQLLLASAEGSLQAIPGNSAADIVAILAQEDQVLTIHEDGSIATRACRDLAEIGQQRRSGKITSAAALPWLDDVRLLLATEDGPILCAGIDDELITQYASPHRAPRIVAGSSETVAAVTADRQRLILWHSWDGRKLRAELHLANLAKHRLADIAFA